MTEKIQEIGLRNWSKRLGLILYQLRAIHWSIYNHRGYMIADAETNTQLLVRNSILILMT